MPFNGPGPGRPKGSTNKNTREIRDAARALIEDPEYLQSLIQRLRAGAAPHMETLMWHYAYGKPKESVEVKHVENDFSDLTPEQLRERSVAVAQVVTQLEQQLEDAVH